MWEKEWKRFNLKFIGIEELTKFLFSKKRRNIHSSTTRIPDLGQEGPQKEKGSFKCKDLAAGQQWGACTLETAEEEHP